MSLSFLPEKFDAMAHTVSPRPDTVIRVFMVMSRLMRPPRSRRSGYKRPKEMVSRWSSGAVCHHELKNE